MWPLLVGVLAVLLVFAVLVLKTQIGVLLGARPPEPGTVDVRTTPGVLADVLLDDVYRGHPPLITDARPGAHRITLTADGYLPVTKSIVVESAKAVAVELSLVAEPAKEPDVVAPAAPVVEQPAQAPAPADHSTARSSDRSRRQDSVTTPRSHSSSGAANGLIAAPTTPAPTALGTLVVNTVPWSLVTIDGHDTGRTTPLLSYPIAPGLHELRLQIATGRVFVERIEVLPGQTVNITRRF